MKIKDKVSGEVYEAETWKSWNGVVQYVKKGTNGPIRSSDDVEIVEEDKPKDTTDWAAFRREAAKDILAGFAGSVMRDDEILEDKTVNDLVKTAVMWTDSLIKQLKEEKA